MSSGCVYPYARTLWLRTRVCTYRRGLRVVGSIILGNATASIRGTGKSKFHAFFCMTYRKEPTRTSVFLVSKKRHAFVR